MPVQATIRGSGGCPAASKMQFVLQLHCLQGYLLPPDSWHFSGDFLNLFTEIKRNLITKEVADFYGIRPAHNGLAHCPFHEDRVPSLKLDARFHCFGCGVGGDAVDFVSRLFSLPVRDAAEKIAHDFSIDYDQEDFRPIGQPRDIPVEKPLDPTTFRSMLARHHRLLCRWAEEYAPQSPEEEWHPQFVEALLKRDHAAYLLDAFQNGTDGEQLALMEDYRNEVNQIEQRLSEHRRNAGSGQCEADQRRE